jgi:hypothetical protein
MKHYQKEFLLKYFFKNEKYAGWRHIAEKLLDTGKCIVAGRDCIWHGGIGNFIHTEPAKNAIDCLEYTFNLEYFLDSEWYKEISNGYIAELASKKREIEEEYEQIINL